MDVPCFAVEFAYRGGFRHLQRILLEPRFEECAEVSKQIKTEAFPWRGKRAISVKNTKRRCVQTANELAEMIIDHGFSIFQG